MAYKIYSLEDDPNISKIINIALSKEGYDVYSFFDGESFLKELNKVKPNLILLDLMLPDCDGFSILKDIRENPSFNDVDVIIVSAKSQISDIVTGFDLGADDYIEKPFDILELISRVNAKQRKTKSSKVIVIDNISLNSETYEVKVSDKPIKLTNSEFKILELLMKKSDEVVSRDEIIALLWGNEKEYETRVIDVHINSLRKKLNDSKHIVAIYGIGYRFLA